MEGSTALPVYFLLRHYYYYYHHLHLLSSRTFCIARPAVHDDDEDYKDLAIAGTDICRKSTLSATLLVGWGVAWRHKQSSTPQVATAHKTDQ